MFEFIKNLFRKPHTSSTKSSCPNLVLTDINESVVITEIKLDEVPPTVTKPKVTKPKVTKPKEVKPVIDNVVLLVQPTAEKVAKPKKPAKPKKVVIEETISLVPPSPKGRPKKTPTK